MDQIHPPDAAGHFLEFDLTRGNQVDMVIVPANLDLIAENQVWRSHLVENDCLQREQGIQPFVTGNAFNGAIAAHHVQCFIRIGWRSLQPAADCG